MSALLLGALCLSRSAPAQQAESEAQSLAELEKLTRTEISTVARRTEELFRSPAAVYVITDEQIHRSSAESTPELLRRVPGLQVQQIQANRWAISARGFNGFFANKMLVLIDGRVIYNADFSGVYWDMYDIALDDIERIEIVRGPGGAMWGANAVNGVINIITKSAARTVGQQVTAWQSTTSRAMGLRDGGQIGGKLFYRVFLKDQLQLPLQTASGATASDAGHSLRGGARLDWKPTASDELTLHGNLFRGRIDQIEYDEQGNLFQDKVQTSGGYLRGHWRHTGIRFDNDLQACYDNENRDETMTHNRVGTYDLDYQQHNALGNAHNLTWGLAGRFMDDNYRGQNPPVFHPQHHDWIFSSFVQDEIALRPEVLTLILGNKLQWFSTASFEGQPSGRLLWTPNAHHSYWTALSRAVRTPSVRDQDMNLLEPYPSAMPHATLLRMEGNPAIKPEDVISYEAGYRWRSHDRIALDVAGFASKYTQLQSDNELQPTTDGSGTVVTIPVTFCNDYHAHAQGLESSLMLAPGRDLSLRLAYSWMQARLRPNLALPLPLEADLGWNAPRNTVSAILNWQFHRGWTLDSLVFFNSRAKDADSLFQNVNAPSYVRADASVSYAPGKDVLLRAGVRNLQSARHLEFDPQNHYAAATEPPRAVYVKLLWNF